MSKNLSLKTLPLIFSLLSAGACASPGVKWEGPMSKQVSSYMKDFDEFRRITCDAKTESTFDDYLLKYRGQGYWIPELDDDVDVATIKSLLPEMERKLSWIIEQKEKVKKNGIPKETAVAPMRKTLEKLLLLKKTELSNDESQKTASRKKSLKLLTKFMKQYEDLIGKVPFLTNYQYPVDHLKNRKVHDTYRNKEDEKSRRIANYAFLYRKLLEDGAYNKDQTGSDIYTRTTIDTLHFELKEHGFYLSEDARYDAEFVLSKIESELSKGKNRILERLTEWEERTQRTVDFYRSLTLPQNQVPSIAGDKTSTPNRALIREHNHAANRLKEYVYKKQADVYKHWLSKPELARAVFAVETILLNEVGGVDGDDALERMDVARVVLNRIDKPQYTKLGKADYIYPYLLTAAKPEQVEKEKWLNALFKQGEFSFTYYYMSAVAKVFCPDMSPRAKQLRKQNVEIALQVLKEGPTSFQTTRYFSRASMVGRIHMDSIWEDYIPYPERPGLLAEGQEKLLKDFNEGKYSYLYSFKDPAFETYQVLSVGGKNYAMGEKKGIKLFYRHRNPHFFKYFTKTVPGVQ